MRVLAPTLAALALAAFAAPPAVAKRDSDTAGDVTATLTWRAGDPLEARTRLVILRAGVEEFAGSPGVRCGDTDYVCERPARFAPRDPLVVRDLDADGEPEVVVALYSGGAHCCVISNVFRWDAAGGHYTNVIRDWGNTGYRLRDVKRDGLVEFVTGDDRFSYLYGAYAATRWPMLIYNLRGGELVDVSRDHARLIHRDARRHWRHYLLIRSGGGDMRSVLAAYAADKHTLGEGHDAWRALRIARRRGELGRSPGRFLRDLRQRLERWGYA